MNTMKINNYWVMNLNKTFDWKEGIRTFGYKVQERKKMENEQLKKNSLTSYNQT
jgi:hypothetical protein